MRNSMIIHVILDEIASQIFKSAKGRQYVDADIDISLIVPGLHAKHVTEEEINKWIGYLVMEDYIALRSLDNGNSVRIAIQPKGISAITSDYFKEEYLKYDREQKMKDLEARSLQSVIETNESVRATNEAVKDNIPIQRKQTNASIFLAFVSLLFIVVTVVNDCNDTTSKELKDIKTQIEEQTKAIQGLQRDTIKIYPAPTNTGKDSANK